MQKNDTNMGMVGALHWSQRGKSSISFISRFNFGIKEESVELKG